MGGGREGGREDGREGGIEDGRENVAQNGRIFLIESWTVDFNE